MLRLNLLRNTVATGTNKRRFWQWLDDTFNRTDDDRIKAVGPDMACAEWLMKNGAQVRWKGCKEFVSHYDCLPKDMSRNSLKHFKVEQVVAGRHASISHIGFGHFNADFGDPWNFSFLHYSSQQDPDRVTLHYNRYKLVDFVEDCKNVSDIAFVECQSINDKALDELKILKDNLSRLKINGCVNVSDIGILNALRHLQALRYLSLKNLPLKNETETIHRLKTALPKCDIIYGTDHVDDDHERNG